MLAKTSIVKTARNKIHSKRANGQALVELCAALIFVIPITLLLLDCVFIFIGASLNDFVCRDAARAAAAGPPSGLSSGAPARRAQTVIKRVYMSGLPMKVRESIDIAENVRDLPPASQGGPVDGEVSVGTTIDIYPPFVVGYIGSGKVVLKSSHSVPITYMRPAN